MTIWPPEIPDHVRVLKKANATRLLKDDETVVDTEYECEGKGKVYGPVIGAAIDMDKVQVYPTDLVDLKDPDVSMTATNGLHNTDNNAGHRQLADSRGTQWCWFPSMWRATMLLTS